MVQQRTKFTKGVVLIELLVAFGLASILLPALLTGFVGATQGREVYEQRIAAIALVREAEESIRSFRNEAWSNISGLTIGTDYYPTIVSGKWFMQMQNGGENINGFIRKIRVFDVYRDASQNIVPQDSPGAILDPSTRQFLITVSWPGYFTRSITSSLYITRYGNDAKPLTTEGTLTGMGHGDWCNPNLHITPYDISGNGIGIAISSVPGLSPGLSNKAYISTGENAASSSLYSVDITDPPYPATPSATTANSYNNGKDYGIFANDDYIFAAARNVPSAPKRLVDIFNIDSITPAGFFDSDPKMNATSVYVSGNTGYVTADTNLIAFSASPVIGSSSQSQLWLKALNGGVVGNKVVVSGGYAYIATTATSNSQQLQVIQLSDHTIYSPPPTGTGSINTNQPGVDIAVLGNYAYLVTNYSSSTTPDIFVVDISIPTAPKVVGTANTYYNSTSMAPLGVATTPNNANILIVVGDGGWQYQTFNVSDPTNPTRCGTPLQNPNGATKVQAVSTLREVDGDVYSYVLTTSGSTQQFQMVEGGSGGGAGGNGGVFESAPFDAGHSVVFNSFKETSKTPSTITTSYQIAVAPGPDCSAATYSYFGNYDASGGQIPLSVNPGQCFRYKVTFTGGEGAPSASATVSVNYSP